jgi:hypothetical protein
MGFPDGSSGFPSHQLWYLVDLVRRLNSFEAQVVAGTDGAGGSPMFWSADGRSLAFSFRRKGAQSGFEWRTSANIDRDVSFRGGT